MSEEGVTINILDLGGFNAFTSKSLRGGKINARLPPNEMQNEVDGKAMEPSQSCNNICDIYVDPLPHIKSQRSFNGPLLIFQIMTDPLNSNFSCESVI